MPIDVRLLAPFLVLAAGEAPAATGRAEPVGDHGHDGGWLRFSPHLSAAVALGGSSSEKNLGLVAGGHAPVDDGFNLQAIELGAVLQFGDRLSVQAIHNAFWDPFDHWDGEWEEAYAEIGLAGDVTLRGGQFFAPFGLENSLHLHERSFIEPPISMIRLLGEDGLIVQGGELAWKLPAAGERWTLKLGYGQAREHQHGEGRELRREAYFEALEGGHAEEEEEHHSHGVAGGGGVYDAEMAYLEDGFLFGRLEARPGLAVIDTAGVSFAAGRNGFGRTTWTAGADLGGGGELAGRPLEWQAETYFRGVEAVDASGADGSFDEFGWLVGCGWEVADHWTLASRLEWASGNRMSGSERRWRFATNISRLLHPGAGTDLTARLQYSYDRLGGYADEHGLWLQLVWNFGGEGHRH